MSATTGCLLCQVSIQVKATTVSIATGKAPGPSGGVTDAHRHHPGQGAPQDAAPSNGLGRMKNILPCVA
jgi:hypothetical protein